MGPLDMQLAGEELYGAGAQPLLRKRVLLNGNTVVGSDWQQEPVGDGEWEIEVLRPSPQQAIHPLVMQRLDMLSRPAVSSAATAVLRHANGRLSRVPADHRATFITDMQAHDRQRLCDAISPDSRQRTGSIARQLDLVSTRRNHQQRAGTLSELDAMVAEAVLHLSGSAALRESMPWEAKVIDAYAELKREGLIRIQG